MNIFTSYFGNIQKIKSAYQQANKQTPIFISIARKPPNGFKGVAEHMDCLQLAPTWFCIQNYKHLGEEQAYIAEYTKSVLDIADFKDLLSTFNNLANMYQADVFLLCYEKSGTFCHRHLVAEHINQQFDYNIVEYILV